MSSRGSRVSAATHAELFSWTGADAARTGTPPPPIAWQAAESIWANASTDMRPTSPQGNAWEHDEPAAAPVLSPGEQQAHLAALERDAFTKGYAQGERAGLEAGGQRAEAMLRRLAATLEELGTLREEMVRQTEQQLVQLALAIARRVLHREASIDPELAAALAHVALERLGPSSPAVIRLHPDDYGTVTGHQADLWNGRAVKVVPDPAVARGGCLVESDFGYIDASVDAQVNEIARAMLGDGRTVSVAVRRGAA